VLAHVAARGTNLLDMGFPSKENQMFVTVFQYEAGSFARVDDGSAANGARLSLKRRFLMAERKNYLDTDEMPGDDLLPPPSIDTDPGEDEHSEPGIDERSKRPKNDAKAREGVEGVPDLDLPESAHPDDLLPPVVTSPTEGT
jgi:hypothetical protein